MGNLKDQALNAPTEDTQQHKLSDNVDNYLRMLNISLQYHTLASQIVSGFLYYVATHELGYKEGVQLSFKYDFDSEDKMLEITLVGNQLTEPPAPPKA